MEAESESSSHARRRMASSQIDTAAEVIAYLGPQGTYGHQVAKRYLSLLPHEMKSATRLESCPTISSVLTHRTATHKIVPLENSIHGSVTETLDTLLSSSLSSSSHPSSSSSSFPTTPASSSSTASKSIGDTLIIGEITLRIQHVLVARKGVSLADVRWVRSHEQALGQCKRFLNSGIPSAKTQKWASTAGAAVSLLDEKENEADEGEVDRKEGAAICSRAALDDLDGLHIIAEDIQDEPNNYTRFLVLSRHHSLSDIHIPNDDHASSTSFWAHESLSDLTYNQRPSSSGPSISPSPSPSTPSLAAVYARPAPPNPKSSHERTPKWFLVEYKGAIKPGPNTRGVYLGVSSWHVQEGDEAQQNGTEKTDADVRLAINHA